MRDLLLLILITIAALIIWIGYAVQSKDSEPKAALETPVPVSGTIDLKFLESLVDPAHEQ